MGCVPAIVRPDFIFNHQTTIMPRQSRQNITKAFFRSYVTTIRTTSGSTFLKTDLKPSALGTRVQSLAQCYEFFRITRLHVESFVSSGQVGTSTLIMGSTVDHAISFDADPSGDIVTPTGFGDMCAVPHFAVGHLREHLKLRVPARDLYQATPAKWYATSTTGTPTNLAASAGCVVSALGLSATGTLEAVIQHIFISGEMEFSQPVDPANVLLLRIPAAMKQEPLVESARAALERTVAKLSAV